MMRWHGVMEFGCLEATGRLVHECVAGVQADSVGVMFEVEVIGYLSLSDTHYADLKPFEVASVPVQVFSEIVKN